MTPFSYDEFVTRNIGFVTPEDQQRLKQAHVFIPGVGGMGGAAFMALVRAGIGHFTIADIDTFEISNLNRQVFASLDTVGAHKAEAAAAAALRINPELDVQVKYDGWLNELDATLARHKVVVNGTDDAGASAFLYRRARDSGATVIDAYAATLPSVYVVRPNDPRPEDRLGYPTLNKDPRTLSNDERQQCLMKELEWALTHSSTYKYVDLSIAAELAAGKRKRFSFAPMVITTGMLMAYEAIRVILSQPGGADHRGYFFNPHTLRVERPLPAPIAAIKGALVRRFMRKMTP